MTLNGTMRVAVMALMVGGLGAALFPLAQAQPPGGFGAAEPVPAPFVAPADATGTPAAAPVWVYKYVEQRREAAAFKKTVSDLGAAGWEYCDHLELDRKATPRGDEVNDMLVFKRPGAAARPPMGNAPVLPAGPGAKGGPPTADELVVFKAKHVRAADVAKTLREVFGVAGGVVEITADERTNSLIVHGSPRVINGVRELLLVLDTPPADPNVPGPKR